MTEITYCQGTYLERKSQTLEGLKRIHPYVDRCIIIAPEPPEEWPELKEFPKVEYYQEEWLDDFPTYRNKYLQRVNYGSFVLVADPDEWFGEEFCKDLRNIVEEAEKQGIGLLLINSHDHTRKLDGTIEKTISNFFKNLIYKYIEGVHYKGVGQGLVHETLIVPPGTKSVSLPRKYFYEHHKSIVEIWERAFRNVWIIGGGNNAGDRNSRWRPLRRITDRLGLKSWPQVREYLRRGNIDKELLEWIRACQKESGWDWQNEMFDCLRYFKAVHPDELPDIPSASELKLSPPSRGSPPEVMRYVEETYEKVLGRHADDRGKQLYTRDILAGKIRREDLPKLLKVSQEYGEKFGPPPSEHVRVPLPINVQVGLSEDHVERVLLQSSIYWKMYKPRLDFARRWEEALKKVKIPHPKLDPDAIEYFKSQVPPNEFLHVLAFSLETAEALDKAGYKTVINTGENTDPHVLPFPNKYFDAVFYVEILQHTLAPFLAISEINRVLKDGGRVIVNAIDLSEEKVLSIMILSHLKRLMQLAGFRKLDENGRLAVYEKVE